MPMLSAGVLYHSHTINVGTFHAFDGTPGYNVLRPISDFVLGKLIQKLDRRIAVSRPAMDFVKKHFPGDYHITPNGVDTKHFNPEVSPIEEFCDGKLNILFVGRLEKRKGADYLLKAYRQLKRDIPHSRLIIVGPGTVLRGKYERAVEKNGLSDVVFAGFSSYQDLPRYYKTADVFCAPATGWESFGIILLEAMAVGKPVVASNIEGYAGVLTNGVEGLLVPPRDEGKLAEALTTLLTDESMRREMGANGTATAQKYDWQNVARQVVDHYKIARSEFPYREKASARRVLREKLNFLTPRKLRFNGKANPSS
jgi:phosphatidylinositol alpha-mannosyltransferase